MPNAVRPGDALRLRGVYDAQLRTEAEVARADWSDRHGPLYRAVFDDFGFVSYRDLGGLVGTDLRDLIAGTVEFFGTHLGGRIQTVEWKTRGHDAPVNLPELLRSCGFVADEPETVMVGVAARLARPVPLPDAVRVRKAGDSGHDLADDVERAVAHSNRVFGSEGHTHGTLLRQLREDPDGVELWLAEADGEVICSGRLEIVNGTDFAGLWGGATAEQWRGQGIYRAITAARARTAVARGVRYLHSDCTQMSRPILERSGLIPVTTTTPYVLTYE